MPRHPGALEYRRRGEPLITGERIGILSNTLQLLIPIGGGIFLVWGWLRARVLTDRERRIDRFIALVSGVEQRALQLGEDGPSDHRAVRELHRELSTIKGAALERIAAGEAGNELIIYRLLQRSTMCAPTCPASSGTGCIPARSATEPRGTGTPGRGEAPSRDARRRERSHR